MTNEESCEFYYDEEYCSLVNMECYCFGLIPNCSYSTELKRHLKSCMDDWYNDYVRENRRKV